METSEKIIQLPPELDGDATNRQRLIEINDGHAMAQAIVDTVREPLLVLNKELCVVTASRSFYQIFKVDWKEVQGRPIYALRDGEWNIPQLRLLLEEILPRHTVMLAHEVEQDFSDLGRRTMLLNAREVFNQGDAKTLILLAIEDVTERRAAERETAALLQQKELLLQEMQHRVANCLQIIASIIQLKARNVQSEEVKLHLEETYERVMSVAAVQQQLYPSMHGEHIDLPAYLSRLCESLANSMIGDNRPISLKVHVRSGAAPSSKVVSLGLIVTELVINAIKYAFADDKSVGLIVVTYDEDEMNWRLTVSDYGIARPENEIKDVTPGMGMNIIDAIAKQLDGCVKITRACHGTTVSVTHGAFRFGNPKVDL